MAIARMRGKLGPPKPQNSLIIVQFNIIRTQKMAQNTTTMSPLCKETLEAIPVLYTFIESVQLVKHFYILL